MSQHVSAVFRSEPLAYIHALAVAWLGRRWLLLACPLAAVAVWAAFDVRAVYVGLIMLFIIYPMALSLVWFNYAFSLQSRRAVADKTVTISDSGLSVCFLPSAADAPALSPWHIAWTQIISASQSSRHVTLVTGQRLDDRLDIPSDALSDNAWRLLFARLPQNNGGLDVF